MSIRRSVYSKSAKTPTKAFSQRRAKTFRRIMALPRGIFSDSGQLTRISIRPPLWPN
jgi:hypothetical protein